MNANRVAKTLVRGMAAAGLVASLAVSLQGCVLLLAGAAGGGAMMATDRRTLGAQTEDREIQVKSYTQISQELPGSHIDVTVFNRRVLLTGEALDERGVHRAEEIVRGHPNVAGVTNEVAVVPMSTLSTRASDSYLVTRVKTALIAEKGISANDFKVVGERGNIYLMGLVTNDEGERGANVAASVPGVMSVVKVYQYIEAGQGQAVAAAPEPAASAPSSAQPEAEPTVGSVPVSSISAQPLDVQSQTQTQTQTQTPAPVTDSAQARPGGAMQGQ
jgi:osmotically-inducible protein OsmY